MIKKIFYTLALFFIVTLPSYGVMINEEQMDPSWASVIKVNAWAWSSNIINLLTYVKDTLFFILGISVVGAFIYVWFLFISSRWNPEAFKKASTSAIYIIIGIALMSAAYGIVSLVVWLDF